MSVLKHLYKSFFVLMLMALAGVQTSCGFQLRGAIELPDQIKPLFLDLSATDDELGRELQALLASSGENALALSRAEAKTILSVSSVSKKQRVVAVDDRGRAREYELNYQFSYDLKKVSEAGMPLEIIRTNTVKLKRSLLFDPGSVLAVNYEKDTLYKDMRKDAAQMVLRQLSTVKQLDLDQTHSQNTYWF